MKMQKCVVFVKKTLKKIYVKAKNYCKVNTEAI